MVRATLISHIAPDKRHLRRSPYALNSARPVPSALATGKVWAIWQGRGSPEIDRQFRVGGPLVGVGCKGHLGPVERQLP
jgi:hypothetical protein